MRILCFCHPDSFGGGCAETNLVFVDRQGYRAVVVSGFYCNPNARTNSLFLKELQELPVALVNTGDHILGARLSLAEQTQSPLAAFRRATENQLVSVRTSVLAVSYTHLTLPTKRIV